MQSLTSEGAMHLCAPLHLCAPEGLAENSRWQAPRRHRNTSTMSLHADQVWQKAGSRGFHVSSNNGLRPILAAFRVRIDTVRCGPLWSAGISENGQLNFPPARPRSAADSSTHLTPDAAAARRCPARHRSANGLPDQAATSPRGYSHSSCQKMSGRGDKD